MDSCSQEPQDCLIAETAHGAQASPHPFKAAAKVAGTGFTGTKGARHYSSATSANRRTGKHARSHSSIAEVKAPAQKSPLCRHTSSISLPIAKTEMSGGTVNHHTGLHARADSRAAQMNAPAQQFPVCRDTSRVSLPTSPNADASGDPREQTSTRQVNSALNADSAPNADSRPYAGDVVRQRGTKRSTERSSGEDLHPAAKRVQVATLVRKWCGSSLAVARLVPAGLLG